MNKILEYLKIVVIYIIISSIIISVSTNKNIVDSIVLSIESCIIMLIITLPFYLLTRKSGKKGNGPRDWT